MFLNTRAQNSVLDAASVVPGRGQLVTFRALLAIVLVSGVADLQWKWAVLSERVHVQPAIQYDLQVLSPLATT